MKAFLNGIQLQWKLDIRNRNILLTYYVVPLLFFAFMSGIFSSINPAAKDTLVQTMVVFGATMGAFLGTPAPLVDLFHSDIKKAYQVGRIPLWTGILNNFISAFLHLFLMSVVIIFISPIAFGATPPQAIFPFLIGLVFFLISSISIGTVLGLAVKNASRLTMISQIFFLPSVMLAGIMFPIDLLPSTLAKIGKLLPAYWGFTAMQSATIDFWQIFPMLCIILIMTIISFWLYQKQKTN